MLHIVCGVARSGKTRKITELIRGSVEGGRRAMLIVPEQASFQNERLIENMLGAYSRMGEAVSFSRLAKKLMQKLGSKTKAEVTPAAQAFFMSVALDELSDVLTVYGRHYRSGGFIEQLLSVIKECQNAGVSPEQLSSAALSMPRGTLRDKAHELSMIYDAFEAALSRSYSTQTDIMRDAAESLLASGLLKDCDVFIDDFSSFTAPEWQMISALLKSARCVTVSLCCDEPLSRQPAFALCADTAKRLLKAADEAGCETKFTVLPLPDSGTALGAMEYAQRCELMPDSKSSDGSVLAVLCASPYDELETVAAEMARMVRSGARYRDFSVIARDMKRYTAALPMVFSAYNIPFFWDMRKDARSSVLTRGIIAAVNAACKVKNADWLEAARSPLFGIEPQALCELENYCFVWSVRFFDWQKPFVNNPDGMAEKLSESAKKRLELIEAARQKTVSPVLRLASALKSGRGGDIANGIWRFLQDIDAGKRLAEFSAAMPENEKREFLDEQSLLWRQTVGVLELFAAVSDEVSFDGGRICELIELAFGQFEVATVFRTLDEVMVGAADRIRCENVKTVFLLGAAQGEFPSDSAPGGLLSEQERRTLSEKGLSLLTDSERAQATEKMFCYRAVTAAEQRLVVCCPRADAVGGQLLPSDIFLRASALGTLPKREAFDRVWSIQSLKKAVAEHIGENDGEAAALLASGRELLGADELERLSRAAKKRAHQIDERPVAEALFGKRITISPSRLEDYYSCPFVYYMKKGLRARRLNKVELSPLQAGTLIHRVLEKLVSSHGGRGLISVSADELKNEITREIESYISQCVADEEAIPARLRRNFDQLGGWIFDMVLRLSQELSQSKFVPAAFEMPIEKGGEVEPLAVKTPSGGEISIEGTVDRVDIAVIGDKKYLRIVDYKSGGKKLSLDDICNGLNLQMLLYLFSIAENGTGALASLLPAGALYAPVKGRYLPAERGVDPAEYEKERQGLYTMSGMLLNDENVLRAMESSLEGKYIPYAEGKKSDSLYSKAEIAALFRMVEQKVCDMAEGLYSGQIAARPITGAAHDPCRFCDYCTACGFEAGDPVRDIEKFDRKAVFEKAGCEDGSEN